MKSMHGAAALAVAKAFRITASASPTKEEEKTSAGESERNATLSDPAAALASVVFAHPGGPCNKIPLGGVSPSLANAFLLVRGHSIA
mmetsp:Transcript_22569/g.34107  ORF Transcript_22569/g.34107 Transcript_22569/m.34107 type:complete len:87 (+) Transcript_22569:594-854(+)